ncbi:MAG: DNA/RNA nuclease SfsA [Oscillospiraceae bacterium]|nr:DNA/RNA nuclease SfsA [Clostridium sp.]MBP3210104.1 DNA/RNA nuclease SfsA [Oscillospiraceae bacterium]MBQ4148574.1 DNA/RNA nuclease SfsA [Clostridium sp.]MBQ5421625.1 DNA/RNA nuclease SfsA [Clostridium sp.]
MKYGEVREALFLRRKNRFVADVMLPEAGEVAVHVKNTGRLRELLLPGARVILAKADNPARKTPYDLIGVYRKEKDGTERLFNIDSQAPNAVVREWLEGQEFDLVRPEYTWGNSRMDFYMEKQNGTKSPERYLMEVKGCTLDRDGIGYFPDAPTERGVKHLHELAKASAAGYHAFLAFVIQMEGVLEVRPNTETHPEFAEALQAAEQAGVQVLHLRTIVRPDSLEVRAEGPGVRLDG